IIAKALRKDRDERYQSSEDLLTDLKSLRRELEFQAEFERKSHSGASSAKFDRMWAETARFEVAETNNPTLHPTGNLAGNSANISANSSASRSDSIAARVKRHKHGLLLTLAVFAAIAGLGFGLYQLIARSSPSGRPVPRITPFTSFPGEEFRASFSPDVNQLAF